MVFAWRYDRKAKGLDVVIRGKSWEHLVKGCNEAKQITRNPLRSLDILRVVGRLGLGVEGGPGRETDHQGLELWC